MNLGGSTNRGSNVPNSQTTSFDQLSEVNKKLRQLDKNLCCKLEEIINNTSGGGVISGVVKVDSSCTSPVYVEVCNQTPGIDKELVFTTAIPICVDNGDGTKSTWYTRENIVWDSVTFTIVSRVEEYSKDGVTWGTTAPSSFVLGSCEVGIIDKNIDLIITEPIELCVNGTTKWFSRQKIQWDNKTSLEVSNITEYSSDGITWSTTAPTGTITLGPCGTSTTTCAISEAFGNDLSTLSAGNNFSITKPSCCKVKITTSVGSFHIINGVQFYNTSDFDCAITIDKVEIISGTCSLDQVHIISNKIK